VALITGYFAFMLTNPSNVVTFLHTSIIITAFLSRVLFKEKLTLAHFVAVFLSFVGVILISKPVFLFPRKKLPKLNLAGLNDTYFVENCRLSDSNMSVVCLEMIANATASAAKLSASSSFKTYAGN
jgi:drug/metabolite transporter (DMT)-like permease